MAFFILMDTNHFKDSKQSRVIPKQRRTGTAWLRIILILALGLIIPTGSIRGSTEALPKVAVSIAPIHSLVAGIMQGVAAPTLIFQGVQSPHTSALPPSAVRDIYQADLVIRIDSDFEVTLNSLLENVPEERILELSKSDTALDILPNRESGVWDAHDFHSEHEEEIEQHGHGYIDPHLWLSTHNAAAMVERIATELTRLDPNNATSYNENSQAMLSRIESLRKNLKNSLKDLSGVPFIVFHDAYQYFEREFGLDANASVSIDAERSPGAKQMKAIHDEINAKGIRCLFHEPLISAKVIKTLAQDTGVSLAKLDPLGLEIDSGSELWFDLMERMAESLKNCLIGS